MNGTTHNHNPTFRNPPFETASYRVLITRLSPLRDVEQSLPHRFLFCAVRRALGSAAYIDLAFFPSAAERAALDAAGKPYWLGIDSQRPVTAFDLVLISNAYTLELINLPYLLIQAHVPLFAGQRRRDPAGKWPLLILGGSNSLATQAIIREDGDSLVDGIFFGEGEERVGDLVAYLAQNLQRERRGRQERTRVLNEAAERVTGFWPAGNFRPVQKAVYRSPRGHSLPVEYPLLDTPGANTASLQITYGCPAFCAFCFEGYDRKPYREVPLSDLLATARQLKQAQGVEAVSLYSFNFNTHRDIFPLMLELHRLFERVIFRSQRVDILRRTPGLLEAEVAADKREFTLGIEGISAHMRASMHKSLSHRDITEVLEHLLTAKIRRIKLFYVLTGDENETDVAEFRQFVKWLKATRKARQRRTRVVFSFGLLIRMPGTPFQYDRLRLDETAWRPLIGAVKSACETNGFEFRLAFDWPAYSTSQVLALGGYWLNAAIVSLAQQGYFFDKTLPPAYWDALRAWMVGNGHWNADFLGEKGPDYPFPLAFVYRQSQPGQDFLYRQYQAVRRAEDTGYCLGGVSQPNGEGHCLGCGACANEVERKTITHHRLHQPNLGPYLADLEAVVTSKQRLRPLYWRVYLPAWLAGATPAMTNAAVFRSLLARHPALTEETLAVRESLLTVRPNADRFPGVHGETVFAFKTWNTEHLEAVLQAKDNLPEGIALLGPAEGFSPGLFTRLRLEIVLPIPAFPDSRARLEAYLRAAYVPYSLRRDGRRLDFVLPRKALKKKVLFGGSIEIREESFWASLEIGPKFDLGAWLASFGTGHRPRSACITVSDIRW